MQQNWQSWAAIAVVILTVLVFIVKKAAKKPAGSCGHDCGCGQKKTGGH